MNHQTSKDLMISIHLQLSFMRLFLAVNGWQCCSQFGHQSRHLINLNIKKYLQPLASMVASMSPNTCWETKMSETHSTMAQERDKTNSCISDSNKESGPAEGDHVSHNCIETVWTRRTTPTTWNNTLNHQLRRNKPCPRHYFSCCSRGLRRAQILLLPIDGILHIGMKWIEIWGPTELKWILRLGARHRQCCLRRIIQTLYFLKGFLILIHTDCVWRRRTLIWGW